MLQGGKLQDSMQQHTCCDFSHDIVTIFSQVYRHTQLEYDLQLLHVRSLWSEDQQSKSELLWFQSHPCTPPDPSPPSLIVTRVSNTTFNLSVSLAYTGGGDITHLIVYFSNGTAWTSLGQIPASPSPESSLVWSVVVSKDEFAGMTVQFEVHAVNQMSFQSPAVVVQEPVCKQLQWLLTPKLVCHCEPIWHVLY